MKVNAVSGSVRDAWLALDDAALLRQCEVDTYRASGPGGQKRNKTSSAVRLRHSPSGVMVIAEESRSQHENKARALRRLRRAIALEVRRSDMAELDSAVPVIREFITTNGVISVSVRSPDFARVVAHALDLLAFCGGGLQIAAERLGVTTSQLSKWLVKDGKVHAAVNQIRAAHDLKPIRGSE